MKEKKTLFSAMITEEDKRKFKEIAGSRQLTMAGVLREWIANSHRAMESKAKRETK